MSSSIPYSACSSFAALSGNSDLRLHSSSETAASYPETDERDVEVANENVTVELGNDEEDKEEERIDHLLEVKKVSQNQASIKMLKKFSNTFDVISLGCMHFALSLQGPATLSKINTTQQLLCVHIPCILVQGNHYE